MYPRIVICKEYIIENAKALLERTQEQGVSITAITKSIAGNIELVEALVANGVTKIGDSRIQNLKKMERINCEKWLIRIPMLSECEEAVQYADISLNSEISTLCRLNEEAKKYGKTHGVILMIDVGDLREGVFLGCGKHMKSCDEALADKGRTKIYTMIERILEMPHLTYKGLGVNSTCFGATIPEKETYGKVIELALELEDKYGLKTEVISGGNSSCYYLLESGELPKEINNMRLGELLLLGKETSYLEEYKFLHQDSFVLEAEIVEMKEKPSYPVGKIGLNSFGEKIEFQDKGIRRRAIIALGKQDVLLEHILPIDQAVTVEGGSSDHVIVDVTESKQNYNVGDILHFQCDYASVLSLCTSEYIETYIK